MASKSKSGERKGVRQEGAAGASSQSSPTRRSTLVSQAKARVTHEGGASAAKVLTSLVGEAPRRTQWRGTIWP